MELAELRALRTPVPTRPSGMAPVRGDAALPPSRPSDLATRPVRLQTDEWAGEEGELPTTVHGSVAEPPTRVERPTPTPSQPAVSPPASVPPPLAPMPPRMSTPAPAPAPAPGPAIGAALLARSGGKRSWLWLALVLVAALGAVAYIVLVR
jgi:hypothetical protein